MNPAYTTWTAARLGALLGYNDTQMMDLCRRLGLAQPPIN